MINSLEFIFEYSKVILIFYPSHIYLFSPLLLLFWLTNGQIRSDTKKIFSDLASKKAQSLLTSLTNQMNEILLNVKN